MAYLADQLPLSAHEGDAVLHGQVQSSLVGLLQREIEIKPVETDLWGGGGGWRLASSHLLCRYSHFLVLPLVEFRVEVSLLGGGSPLGGGLLVG